MAHRIRLRSGWDVSERDGRIASTRHFGRPRTLDPDERVWLVWPPSPSAVDVVFNGAFLVVVPSEAVPAIDLTSHLNPRNELQLVGLTVEALGEVALEIRADD